MSQEHTTNYYEHFSHEADIGVRGVGENLEEAFEQAALAMTAVIVDPDLVIPQKIVHINCDSQDPELLLVEWLSSIIYEMSTRNMLFGKFDVNITDGVLNATVWGEPVNVKKHQPTVEVKGASYTELKVSEAPDGLWTAQCVVDV